jgi:hypothetical protein
VFKPKIRKRKARVEEPLTEEMLELLLKSDSAAAFCDSNSISAPTLPQYLEKLLQEKGLRRPQVIKSAGINATFGYQIFTGARGASRDTLLKLAFAMGLDLRCTQRLLKIGGAGALYCKVRRDAIIIFALTHGQSLQATQEDLYRLGEATID